MNVFLQMATKTTPYETPIPEANQGSLSSRERNMTHMNDPESLVLVGWIHSYQVEALAFHVGSFRGDHRGVRSEFGVVGSVWRCLGETPVPKGTHCNHSSCATPGFRGGSETPAVWFVECSCPNFLDHAEPT